MRQNISVRPRVGSALERVQKALSNDMKDLIHDWASRYEQEQRKEERHD